MELIELIQEILGTNKSPKDNQKEINAMEVGHLWNLLVARYDVLHTTQLLHGFTDDTDLKSILKRGLKMLEGQIKTNENLLEKYGIPLPQKPPVSSTPTENVEEITDQYIFRRLFRGIQGFIPILCKAFTDTANSEIRDYFQGILIKEIQTFDKLVEYGKLKGWLHRPPSYKN